MAKRGRIMRDTHAGPGLVMVQGQQHAFALEGVWRSETVPKPGLVVDVEFGPDGQVSAITAISESQLAREQAEAALQSARERGAALASGVVTRFGLPRLVAAGLVIIGWYLLSTITVDAALLGRLKINFWQVLGFLNTDSPLELLARGRTGGGAGIYGVAALACLAGPFITRFWKDRRAHLAGALPLVFMLVVAVFLWLAFLDLTGGNGATSPEYDAMFRDMQREARREAMQAVSIGAGAWVSLLASIYLAFAGVKRFLVNRASDQAAHQG